MVMDYVRSQILPKTPLKNRDVTLIWCNDGWCYIPALGIRQRFTEKQYFFQPWDGIIGMPQYLEDVKWCLFSEQPRIWSENNDVFTLTSLH